MEKIAVKHFANLISLCVKYQNAKTRRQHCHVTCTDEKKEGTKTNRNLERNDNGEIRLLLSSCNLVNNQILDNP